MDWKYSSNGVDLQEEYSGNQENTHNSRRGKMIIGGTQILWMLGILLGAVAIGLIYLWWCEKNNWGD